MAQKLLVLLDQIDNGTVHLPEFQRGYVWNRDQVRGLMRSLYRRYPVGSLLLWQTRSEGVSARGSGTVPKGYVELLLDGQQRITSLYGIVRGKPPTFFEGHAEAFTGLHFHLEDEAFEFYAPAKMRGNPLWVDVTRLMQEGIGPWVNTINASPELSPRLADYINRLNAICGIKEMDFHSEVITGEDKTVDVVVEIFDRVNSGGTKLSKADLALAKVCADWPDARPRLRSALTRWDKAGFQFKIDWLLRVVNAVATGEAMFSKLTSVTTDEFAGALGRSEKIIDTLLNNVSSHLGLDHDRVLAGRYGFPVMVRCLDRQGGKFADAAERDRLLYWYVHSFLWARYSGAGETILNQDLDAVDTAGVDRLIELLAQNRGDLVVRPADFAGGYGLGARFYPLLYMLTRVQGARDFWNGAPELKAHLLGKLSSLQVHHIFPKAKLYRHDYTRGQVNDIANFCYLTQETNLWVTDRDPQEYFHQVEEKYPGALASQWIPLEPELWQMGRYLDFLDARRVLLAQAANKFLDSLLAAPAVAIEEPAPVMPVVVGGEPEADEALAEVAELVGWMREQGYAEPELNVEIADPGTAESLAIAEAYWSRGLQEGMGESVVLELELTENSDAKLRALGYRVFPSVASLRSYVELQARQAAGQTEASLDGAALGVRPLQENGS